MFREHPVRHVVAMLLLLCASLSASRASAHFKLLQPDSWLKEGTLGEPQKAGPCGPGGYDDIQPVPTSGDVTTVHAGDTISVEVQETVYHAGYWRISLAADRSTFTDPPLTDTSACTFDLDSVPTGAHDNVLMDGLDKTSAASGSNRHLTHQVTLPDQPCDKCTLQVIQVMMDHGPPNCFYYHCADLKILPATGAAGSGAGGAGASGTSAGAGGTSVAAGSGGAGAAGSAAVGGSVGASGASGASGAGTAGSIITGSGGAGRAASSAGASGVVSATAGTGVTAAAGQSATAPVTPAKSSSSSCAVSNLSGAHGTHGALFAAFGWLAIVFARRARRRR
jgi:hypothetical protein